MIILGIETFVLKEQQFHRPAINQMVEKGKVGNFLARLKKTYLESSYPIPSPRLGEILVGTLLGSLFKNKHTIVPTTSLRPRRREKAVRFGKQ